MISAVLLVSVAHMENRHRRKDWREEESIEDAARRLLAELDERVRRKASERLEGSEKIADRPWSQDERGGSESDGVTGSLDRCRQSTPTVGGNGGDPALEGVAERGLGCGQTDFDTVRFSLDGMEAACPARGDFHVAERARHAPEDEVE
ncbi:hypothetical protein EN866_34250 [Mesorhizobium sp. M2D.F.Ca.ET.223.01.1.1]|uniref:hypothetical protein n=1 Tax=Mesorhizobium sp. M2D.F.Ca.ET.223.01.1.1 TaxID=2563940 RepID=UPI001092197B|nr:hypothetical protein [Mesorhizobium sp. M2D.F.Ca.ET.223.01.1.1]TGR83313.1 hypothetical protein EN866_34250 [Mesorhizobium sp. M2D.F.Ca.ET.223.01.1.1]TGT65291.1 hypothetical protein EN802_31925 [bacterium M00.F.Ca.ET.159.01.1.1]TGT79402.1 hypothetical protein EN800_31265 [bacterium M00.F.Ca.ET.157.01.1.1]